LNPPHEEKEKQPEPNQTSLPLPVPMVSTVPDSDARPPRCTEKTPSAFLRSAQSKCNGNSVIGFTAAVPANQTYKSQATQPRVAPHIIESQHQRVRHVPAFGPLTKVISPVVSRAQWEIVVRSAFVAFFIGLTIVGSLLAVPVRN
jgi:hypothetical protein